MKKIICFVLSVSLVLALVLPMAVSAAEETYVLATEADYTALGVNVATNNEGKADPSLYNVDGKVINFRVSSSPSNFTKYSGDNGERWLAHKENTSPSSLYLGEKTFDMSKVTSITIDWLANKKATATNVVSLTKDAAGQEVVATVEITNITWEGGSNMDRKFTSTLTVTDATYNGPLYLYLDSSSTRMFIGNLQITVDNTVGDTGSDNTGSDSGNTETNPETGDFGVIALAFAAVSSLVIKKKKEI